MEEKARVVLAANLKSLMAERQGLETFPQIIKRGGPSNGTLDRIRRHESGCSVDQLDLLAKVFEIEPWHLLVPNLKPNSPPILLGAGAEAERMLWERIESLMAEVKRLREASGHEPGNAAPGREQFIAEKPNPPARKKKS